MKRIVQCPQCETKLSVFDLGKPISQKCPKCGNTFEVTPEGAADASEKPSVDSPTPAEETAPKEIKLKPPVAAAPVAAPSPVPAASPEPVIVESGITFLHVLVIFALLLTIIGVQIVTFKKLDARFNAMKEQNTALREQVSALSAQVLLLNNKLKQ
ncbi:MAG: hypothetical protein FWG50_06635 [Kiritimatiellaeota bacterium]|nr:hypothetical protein [Kiritimatiellota bacterium]